MSSSPKDNSAKKAPAMKPIESPAGLDLHPKPHTSARVSKRAGIAVGAIAIVLLGLFAYGGYRRQMRAQLAARDSGLPKVVAPATASANEVEKDIPSGNAPLVRNDPNQLQPPDTGGRTASSTSATCGFDPHTGQPYRFNPDTGQPCTQYAQGGVAIRQAGYAPVSATSTPAQPTPEEQRIAAEYQREQEAMISPTNIKSGGGAASFDSASNVAAQQQGNDDLARIAALSQSISGHDSNSPATVRASFPTGGSRNDADYEAQNMQTTKAAFLTAAQKQKTDDYLQSTRMPPLSPYEIKAGWEIPAVLEQNLNSDLPGDIKALITSNVFDTATGRYLLIPQGSRLIGKYDSRISYGQDGVQVVWDRIIFPDASSVDINGMVGLDAHGNSGLRFAVDHHYKRLFGFAALTSAFSAAFGLSQRNTQSALTYPSLSSTAGAAVGQEMSQTGAMITQRNMNVQPTIKVPTGYQFTVRVNRDMLFDAPYQALQANPLPAQPPGQLHHRSSFTPATYNTSH
ncbi:MAG TPA: TrbI/VirB10 family protein [Bryobacteraceae bacterium]|nr:TrbI/VirB10 family protein [Bryobacteraceae bacterium]